MKLHHIGTVTPDLGRAQQAWAQLGYEPLTDVIFDPIQKARLLLLRGAGGTIELIAPASEDSPAAAAVRRGGGLNHLCYEVDDLNSAVAQAVQSGAISVCPPVHAVLFNRRVAFVCFRDLGVVELLECAVGG
jgi:methylmalonyl-CoA/ethylmalonyl-CoA epimerase